MPELYGEWWVINAWFKCFSHASLRSTFLTNEGQVYEAQSVMSDRADVISGNRNTLHWESNSQVPTAPAGHWLRSENPNIHFHSFETENPAVEH